MGFPFRMCEDMTSRHHARWTELACNGTLPPSTFPNLTAAMYKSLPEYPRLALKLTCIGLSFSFGGIPCFGECREDSGIKATNCLRTPNKIKNILPFRGNIGTIVFCCVCGGGGVQIVQRC